MANKRRNSNDTNVSIDSLIARLTAIETPVSALYQNTAGTTVNNTSATIPFATKIFESQPNLIVGGVFTAPITGKYAFSAFAFSVTTINTSTSWYFLGLKNNATLYAQDDKAGTGAPNTGNTVRITGIVDLIAGETFQIKSSLDTASSLTLVVSAGVNMFGIWRIGA